MKIPAEVLKPFTEDVPRVDYHDAVYGYGSGDQLDCSMHIDNIEQFHKDVTEAWARYCSHEAEINSADISVPSAE